MRKFKNYEKTETYSNTPKIPAGVYQIVIKKATPVKAPWGQEQLQISFDIAEGEYKDFYLNKWNAEKDSAKRTWGGTYNIDIPDDSGSEDDQKRMRKFKTLILNIEDSNESYVWDWDEKKLKDKKVGMIYGDEYYSFTGESGKTIRGISARPKWTISVGEMANAKIPGLFIKNNLMSDYNSNFVNSSASNASSPANDDDFMNIPDGIAEDLPF